MDRITQILAFLEDSPDDAFLLYALATEYVAKSDDEKAEKIFTQLLEKHPHYVATYYHLAKLQERKNDKETAKNTYQSGITIAKTNKEQHALSELQSALMELEMEDW